MPQLSLFQPQVNSGSSTWTDGPYVRTTLVETGPNCHRRTCGIHVTVVSHSQNVLCIRGSFSFHRIKAVVAQNEAWSLRRVPVSFE